MATVNSDGWPYVQHRGGPPGFLRVLGRMRFDDARDCPPEHLEAVALPEYRARIERIVYINVVAFDWNCPQYITRRYTPGEFEALSDLDNTAPASH